MNKSNKISAFVVALGQCPLYIEPLVGVPIRKAAKLQNKAKPIEPWCLIEIENSCAHWAYELGNLRMLRGADDVERFPRLPLVTILKRRIITFTHWFQDNFN